MLTRILEYTGSRHAISLKALNAVTACGKTAWNFDNPMMLAIFEYDAVAPPSVRLTLMDGNVTTLPKKAIDAITSQSPPMTSFILKAEYSQSLTGP